MIKLNICAASVFLVVLLGCSLLQQCSGQTTVRPYKFGFTIDEQQHRSEKRDERGIVMGEFGFITADGIYHVTVYATDEEGKFRILAMKSYPYESPPKTMEIIMSPKPAASNIVTTTVKPKQELSRHNFYNEGCSGCFLKNADDEPKAKGAADASKSGIRPLSKALPNASKASNVPATKPSNVPAINTAAGTSSTGINKPSTPAFTNTKAPTSTNTYTNNKIPTSTFNTNTKAPTTVFAASKAPAPSLSNTRGPQYNAAAASNVVPKTQTPPTGGRKENKQTFAAKTPTKEMDIMDIIVKDVLPAVVGSEGVVSAPPTIMKPSGKSPTNSFGASGKSPSSKSGSNAFGKGSSSNFNPKIAAVGGDGDLYRFKYILDYHGHTETGKRNGNKEGNFYAIGDDNVERTIEYVANENGYYPHITWRRLNEKESRPAENTLKEYEFVWFTDN
ncbi:protein lethal(3)malignant blood neoplasm 1 isoform X1 [Stomoxys calcitrans]|uniref:protein lethal(3)malignant blood neoplasm 1 isoform X1 n=1 Tax=Stomoxys calcitrans TaxID=35570 RepID=UPI0027E28FE8|nr:protein lethal(3)malignant blood neoplasm 1 isoform X1 [Stomoxys calcitrans]